MQQAPHRHVVYESAAEIRSLDIAELHDYWRSKCVGRALPHPSAIVPGEIPHLLHSVAMSEYSDRPFRVRYVMVGATQMHYAGEDYTGCYLDELHWSEKGLVAKVHEAARDTKAPVFGRYQWDFREYMPGFCEFGIFPLSADGAAVTGGICYDDYSFFEQQLGRAR